MRRGMVAVRDQPQWRLEHWLRGLPGQRGITISERGRLPVQLWARLTVLLEFRID